MKAWRYDESKHRPPNERLSPPTPSIKRRETLETMNNDSPSPRSILLPSSPPLSPYQEQHASDADADADADLEHNSALNEYDSSSFLPTFRVQTFDNSADDSELQSYRNDGDEFDGDLSMPNRTAVEEGEMHMKLMDMESSFLPEPSTIGIGRTPGGADDTYLVGVHAPSSPATPATPKEAYKVSSLDRIVEADSSSLMDDTGGIQYTHATPSTPTPIDAANTSALETMSSSPTAEAAARTVSRAVSSTFSGAGDSRGVQEQRRSTPDGNPSQASLQQADLDATPRRSRNRNRDSSPDRSMSQHNKSTDGESSQQQNEAQSAASTTSERRRIRPKYLVSRQSSHRLSASSIATVNTDAALSDANMGLDYALQSGGAVPMNSDKLSQNLGRPKSELARSTSLGSMASGVSALSDDNPFERRAFSGVSEVSLHTLNEEEPAPQARPTSSGTETKRQDDTVPSTPKAKAIEPVFPPDSVLTQRTHDVQASSTNTRQFRDSNLSISPDKRPHPTPGFGRGRNMTLKEQSSTIDRLSKENFDLKMRIHFLNQALSKRSEEGVKEMISENVELKSGKLKLQKDNQSLRRMMRELERQLKDKGDNESNQGDARESEDERRAMDEEELVYLRERTESYEIEIERLRTENITKESDKRRLAELVKAMGDGRGPTPSDMGAREERDMWKDMLEAETAAREQVEEENRRLREEMFHIRGDSASSDTYHPRSSRRSMRHSVMSRPGSDNERSIGRTTTSSTTLVEVELLKQENAELRREVSAQTSMLTSRNREKERLYQEIEDLKLQRRGEGSRSAGGDSIFERSASRVHGRSASRASDGTRSSHLSDMERDTLETKNGELRDLVSTLKLENQALRADLDEYVVEVERVEREYQGELEGLEEHLQHLQLERNHAVQIAEGREEELQELKDEAQEELDAIGDELEMKHEECQRLEIDLQNQQENLKALQAEVRSANEGIIRLEEDAQNNLQKYRSVQEELDDANRELESMEKGLFESNSKVQRLTVQQESSQNEIAFLREEQDADKIKIGDMESELRMTHTGLQSEREKTRELDMRLAEERHQREVVGGKEKQDVQRIMNDLNREASGSKDEIRKLRKSLSAREIEASTWKGRFIELENNLREALGDLNGTRSSLLTSITNLQKELESTTLELETLRHKLDEKESLLRNRDALLESHGLETRKLADLLERERQAHRADKHSFEQSLKSHQQASRTIAQNNSRISDLENARGHDRKKFSSVEQQFKDQLNERNAMLLNLWKRISMICGPDWTHSNSLINGNLPSQEVIGNMLFWPGFSRNLLLAIKTVEGVVNGFKTRIRAVEHNLTKEYQNLEHSYGLRVKKLDRLEDMVQQMWGNRRPLSSNAATSEISKLRGENRLLKAELNLLQSHPRSRASNNPAAAAAAGVTSPNPRSDRSNSNVSRASSNIPQPSNFSSATTLAQAAGTLTHSQSQSSSEPSQAQWIQRLRELERRLKAEREARLLDRSGARKRLEERNVENEQLRAALEREKINRPNPSSSSLGGDVGGGGGMGDYGHEDHRDVGYGDDHGNGRSRSDTVQRVSSTRQPKQGREMTHARENEADQRGEFVVIDHVFDDDLHERRHRQGLRRSRGHGRGHGNEARSGEDSDSYDGGIDDDDDDGTGTGTDDGGGLCVEVEV